MAEKEYLSYKECAQALGCSLESLYQNKILRTMRVKIGNKYYISRSDLFGKYLHKLSVGEKKLDKSIAVRLCDSDLSVLEKISRDTNVPKAECMRQALRYYNESLNKPEVMAVAEVDKSAIDAQNDVMLSEFREFMIGKEIKECIHRIAALRETKELLF